MPARRATRSSARIRTALADRAEVPEVPWSYGLPVGTGDDDLVARFIERTADYRAVVERVGADGVGAAIAAALAGVGATTVVADAAVRDAGHRTSTRLGRRQ